MAINWNVEVGGGLTAEEWLSQRWGSGSDADLASQLSQLTGQKVTYKAVERKRHKLGLRRARGPGAAELPPVRDGETVRLEEAANTATAFSNSQRITTLGQLLEACQVDLKTWRVDHYLVNKWEVGAKVGDGAIVVEPLFQVKAWLVRRKPKPLFPVVRPLEARPSVSAPCQVAETSHWRRALVWGDPHFGFRRRLPGNALEPFHCRRSLDVILQLASLAEVDRVDVAGDLLDLADWTDDFVKSPEFYWLVQPAVLEAHWWLAQLRQARPDAEMRAYEGNHDERMRRAIKRHLPAAYDLRPSDQVELPALSVPRLLGLESLGIEWCGDYPDNKGWLNDSLAVEHGDIVKRPPGATAREYVEKRGHSTLFFHTHRPEMATQADLGRWGRRQRVALCPGCCCRVDGVVPGSTERNDWANGAVVVDYDPGGEEYHLAPARIVDGRTMWRGQVIEARDRLEELKETFPEWSWR